MGAEVMRGVAIEGASWAKPPEIKGFERQGDFPPPDGGVGFIMVNSPAGFHETVRAMNWPAVSVLSHHSVRQFPTVLPDEAGVGKIACDHLLLKGYRHLAYYGTGDPFSAGRYEGFVSQARSQRRSIKEGDVISPRHTTVDMHALKQPEQLKSFLRQLRPATGVLAANDELACALRDAAFAIGLNVPDDLGIVGVDNMEVLTAYGKVSISSVDMNGIELGKTAMRLLSGFDANPATSQVVSYTMPAGLVNKDSSQTGATPLVIVQPLVIVPPLGVVQRKSTDALIVTEPEIAAAIRWTREHACDGIDANDVQRQVLVSRRTIDRWFITTLTRTCSDEIARVRLQRAQSLLNETDLPLSEIASRCGYHYLSHFSHAFRKATTVSPSQWRKQNRDR